VRLLRQLPVADHAQSRREGLQKLSLLETVLFREIGTPFEIPAVEGLENQCSAGLQGVRHRGPERAVEKADRNEHIVALPGKRKADEVARDRAHLPSFGSSRRGQPAERVEAPIESFHREALLREVERISPETAREVEGESAAKLRPALSEERRRPRQILGVPMLLLPTPSI
jgi:hypothetical protein